MQQISREKKNQNETTLKIKTRNCNFETIIKTFFLFLSVQKRSEFNLKGKIEFQNNNNITKKKKKKIRVTLNEMSIRIVTQHFLI